MANNENLPSVYKKIVVQKLSTNFAEATEIISTPMPVLKPEEVIIKTKYLGVNATDINITAGRYGANTVIPFDAGIEALGEIAAVGNNIKHLKVGQFVAYIGIGTYAEYLCVPGAAVSLVPKLNPEYLALMISGRTAAIGLDKAGHIQQKDTVLITAAAGGAGIIAVQYAKNLGCHVIGTCSSDEKMQLLKELKCDRPINYRKEKIEDVLKNEYPNGVDVVWETIGGEMLETCLKHLAVRGRLIVIGYVSTYKSKEGYKPLELSFLPKQLLWQSSSITGFMLSHYQNEFANYHDKLLEMHETKKLRIFTDLGDETTEGSFIGLESVGRAVQHLHSGTSKGKVIVKMLD